MLEQYGFSLDRRCIPRTSSRRSAQKIDVLIIADDARVPVAGAAAGRGGRGGAAPTVRPEYAYQLTAGDLQGFEQFVRGGGTARLPEQREHLRDPAVQAAGAGTSSPDCGRRNSSCAARSSRSTTDPTHPVMAGMPDKAAVFVDGSPVFETQEGFKGTVLARYQESGSPLLSGYLIGEKYLQGKAAALDVQLDAGHVVLLGFRPEWRGQPFGTFRVLFNAALFSR